MTDNEAVRLGLAALGGATVASAGIYVLYRLRQSVRKRKMTLYHSYPFRSCRCAWLISEIGVEGDFNIVKLNLHSGNEAEVSSYRANVHPHGTIPALVIQDGPTMLESGAICMYIADLYGKLVPDNKHREDYYNWAVYGTVTLDSILEPLYMQLTHTPEDKRDNSLIRKQTEKFNVFARHLSGILEKQDYVCGDRFTAADCIVGYCIWWAGAINKGMLLNDYPYIKSYGERLSKRPAFQKVFKKDD